MNPKSTIVWNVDLPSGPCPFPDSVPSGSPTASLLPQHVHPAATTGPVRVSRRRPFCFAMGSARARRTPPDPPGGSQGQPRYLQRRDPFAFPDRVPSVLRRGLPVLAERLPTPPWTRKHNLGSLNSHCFCHILHRFTVLHTVFAVLLHWVALFLHYFCTKLMINLAH